MKSKYIEKNLTNKEETICIAKINSFVLIIPKLIIPIFFMLGLIYTDFSNENIGTRVFIIYLLIEICSCYSLIKTIIDILTTDLGITNIRVIGKRGLFKTISLDAPLKKINDVELHQNLTGKIFKYFTIKISTSSNKYSFRYIKNANELKNKLLNLI